MGPIQATTTCFRKYATFSGRASRSEYWWFGLVLFLGFIPAYFIDTVVFNVNYNDIDTGKYIFSPALELFSLATLLPSWAVAVRRMQDISQNGKIWFWAFGLFYAVIYFDTFLDMTNLIPGYETTTIYFVTIFGALFFLIIHVLLAIKRSQPDENKYGPNPLEVTP
jgi:uncharacterized membrane protein YhaH (DUF805 family)